MNEGNMYRQQHWKRNKLTTCTRHQSTSSGISDKYLENLLERWIYFMVASKMLQFVANANSVCPNKETETFSKLGILSKTILEWLVCIISEILAKKICLGLWFRSGRNKKFTHYSSPHTRVYGCMMSACKGAPGLDKRQLTRLPL